LQEVGVRDDAVDGQGLGELGCVSFRDDDRSGLWERAGMVQRSFPTVLAGGDGDPGQRGAGQDR
jgi:hypothetical protein